MSLKDFSMRIWELGEMHLKNMKSLLFFFWSSCSLLATADCSIFHSNSCWSSGWWYERYSKLRPYNAAHLCRLQYAIDESPHGISNHNKQTIFMQKSFKLAKWNGRFDLKDYKTFPRSLGNWINVLWICESFVIFSFEWTKKSEVSYV